MYRSTRVCQWSAIHQPSATRARGPSASARHSISISAHPRSTRHSRDCEQVLAACRVRSAPDHPIMRHGQVKRGRSRPSQRVYLGHVSRLTSSCVVRLCYPRVGWTAGVAWAAGRFRRPARLPPAAIAYSLSGGGRPSMQSAAGRGGGEMTSHECRWGGGPPQPEHVSTIHLGRISGTSAGGMEGRLSRSTCPLAAARAGPSLPVQRGSSSSSSREVDQRSSP